MFRTNWYKKQGNKLKKKEVSWRRHLGIDKNSIYST